MIVIKKIPKAGESVCSQCDGAGKIYQPMRYPGINHEVDTWVTCSACEGLGVVGADQ